MVARVSLDNVEYLLMLWAISVWMWAVQSSTCGFFLLNTLEAMNFIGAHGLGLISLRTHKIWNRVSC